MKTKSTRKRTTSFFTLSLSAGLLLAQASFATAKPVRHFTAGPGEEEPVKKAKTTKTVKSAKSFASLNNNSVKIYPDIIKRDMHVIAKENEGKEVDFFVFDLQGTLVQNYKMKAKDHIKIAGLARGSYVYRVFRGDEETAAGKFEIR